MKKHSIGVNFDKVFVFIFLSGELLIYSSFLYMDLAEAGSGIVSNYLKFSGIILCFFFTLFFLSNHSNRSRTDSNILKAALLFTVISDLLILILDYYIIGLITFCIVQTLYLVRLSIWKSRLDSAGGAGIIIKSFFRNVVVSLLILCILRSLKIKTEGLLIFSSFYFISSLFNVLNAIKTAYRSKMKSRILFACSMVLFLLCDINVGLFNLSGFIAIDSNWFIHLHNFAAVAMWMFYLPAQVGITLSGMGEGCYNED